MNNRKLVLENGQIFEGIGFGSLKESVGILTFNNGVVGYQEMISDPTNYEKIVCMTYPLIGNYGLTDEDYESKYLSVKGLIVKEYNELPSNFRYTRTLSDVMEENNICGIANIETRKLMKIIREEGSQKAVICDITKPIAECIEILNNYTEPTNLVSHVSSKKVWYSRTPNPIYNVGVIDLGTKKSFIHKLNKIGCNVIVFPYNVTKKDILKYKPDGLFISNGPGSPENLESVINTIKEFIGILPIFGISLGCELIAKAYNIEINKSKHGNHGSNYPVKNLLTNKVEITSQNHDYIINKESLLNTSLQITHENVIDKEIAGIFDEKNKIIGIQFEHIAEIDQDSENIFKEFFKLMTKSGGKK